MTQSKFSSFSPLPRKVNDFQIVVDVNVVKRKFAIVNISTARESHKSENFRLANAVGVSKSVENLFDGASF